MSFRYIAILALSVGVVLIAGASASVAQVVNWINPGKDDWNVGSNWSGPFGNEVPQAQFGESANISNGGTAYVASSAPAVGGVTLGQSAGQSGTLDIRDGGAVSAILQGGTTGAVAIGPGGTGSLVVHSGGTLSALSIASGDGTTLRRALQ